MIYYVYSPHGRTGSWRLCKMISNSFQNYGRYANSWHDPADEHYCHHVHNLTIPIPDQAIPILTTRRDKTNIILSVMIAQKNDQWHSYQTPVEPFTVEPAQYIKMSKDLLEKEQFFINQHNPIIIALEDSIEDIEKKLNIILPYKENDTAYISKNKAFEVIENYSEIQAIADTLFSENNA
jgi:hypothetical protein